MRRAFPSSPSTTDPLRSLVHFPPDLEPFPSHPFRSGFDSHLRLAVQPCHPFRHLLAPIRLGVPLPPINHLPSPHRPPRKRHHSSPTRSSPHLLPVRHLPPPRHQSPRPGLLETLLPAVQRIEFVGEGSAAFSRFSSRGQKARKEIRRLVIANVVALPSIEELCLPRTEPWTAEGVRVVASCEERGIRAGWKKGVVEDCL